MFRKSTIITHCNQLNDSPQLQRLWASLLSGITFDTAICLHRCVCKQLRCKKEWDISSEEIGLYNRWLFACLDYRLIFTGLLKIMLKYRRVELFKTHKENISSQGELIGLPITCMQSTEQPLFDLWNAVEGLWEIFAYVWGATHEWFFLNGGEASRSWWWKSCRVLNNLCSTYETLLKGCGKSLLMHWEITRLPL